MDRTGFSEFITPATRSNIEVGGGLKREGSVGSRERYRGTVELAEFQRFRNGRFVRGAINDYVSAQLLGRPSPERGLKGPFDLSRAKELGRGNSSGPRLCYLRRLRMGWIGSSVSSS
ncbi:hypothetical protein GCM10023156_02080 [Novipirellula rosea]|uniref:Uncharacterized protein n=1 Tax=Novipirellula rosea TaxID=1031540 RepID=A0ABP8M5E8_9BACT